MTTVRMYLLASQLSRMRLLKPLSHLDDRLLLDIGITRTEAKRGRPGDKRDGVSSALEVEIESFC